MNCKNDIELCDGNPCKFPDNCIDDDITLRDYFAARAMPALLDKSSNPYEIARWAYQIAQAMIDEREKDE